MATTEKMGLITQIEESGNETILYPKTKAKLVEGLIETIKETVQGSGGGGTDEATVDAKISAHNTDIDSHNDIRLQVRGLHNDKADKAGLSLGTASDGLIYIFVDGAPVGTGIQQGQSGDVFGYVDENNTVVLTGNLADGTYSIKYETEDADGNTKTVDIGDLVLDTNTYYTVTSNLTKCTSSNSAKTVAAGGRYQTTITANTGYMITSWKVTMGGVDISSAYESGTVTIEKVTGDIVIMAYAVQTSYSVTNNLSNCSTNNSATTVTYGFPYNATITANEGYVLSSVSVTMGGVAVTATGGVISIASVTGDIVITATATEEAVETHAITYTYDENAVTITGMIETVVSGGDLELNLKAKDGYTIQSVTATMSGITETATKGGEVTDRFCCYVNTDGSAGFVQILNTDTIPDWGKGVTGDTVITVAAEKTVVPPAYTNVLPDAVDANDNDYVGDNGEDGYKSGFKISVSSGNESAATACVSGFIKLPEGKQSVIRIKNITLSSANSINNFLFYDANKAKISGYYAGAGTAGAFHSDVPVTDGVYLFSTMKWFPNDSTPVYFRFSCLEITEATIVTIDEEIV